MENIFVVACDETTPVQDMSNSWVKYSWSGIKPQNVCPPKITRYTVFIKFDIVSINVMNKFNTNKVNSVLNVPA